MKKSSMISQEQKALLRIHLWNALLSILLHVIQFGFLIWLSFFTGSRFINNARQALLHVRIRTFIILFYPTYFLTELLGYFRLVIAVCLDLITMQTKKGNLRDWRQAIPEHYVWSKSKRYIRVLPYAGKAENSVKKEAKKQGAMGKNRDSALGKGLRKLHAFIQEVIMNYVFAVRAVLLDGCVCNTEKAEGLLQSAGGGKSYIYTAARYSGVIFEFYAERNPERVWSISPERDTSESVPPKPQKKRQI